MNGPRLLFLFLPLLVTTRASAAITWRGDFETGDLSQWTKAEEVAGSPVRLLPVTASELAPYGTRQGTYALRVTVVQGDNPINASGNRNELVHDGAYRFAEGDDVYLAWSTLFPADFGDASTWQVFTQFHHTGCCGSPPLEFDVTKEQVQFVSQKEGVFDETVLWSTPLVRGAWHDFIVHVKWSTDANVGFVELWYEGAQVVAKTNVRTLFSDGFAYLKQGYYRDASIAWTGTIFHDGTRTGTTLADVLLQGDADAGFDDGGASDAGSVDADVADAEVGIDAGTIDGAPDARAPDASGASDASSESDSGASGSGGAQAAGCAMVGARDARDGVAFVGLAGAMILAARRRRRRARVARASR